MTSVQLKLYNEKPSYALSELWAGRLLAKTFYHEVLEETLKLEASRMVIKKIELQMQNLILICSPSCRFYFTYTLHHRFHIT